MGRTSVLSHAEKEKSCSRWHRKSPAFFRTSPVLNSENQPCLLNYLPRSCPSDSSCACVAVHEPETHDISSCQANCSDDNWASCTHFCTSYPIASNSYSPCCQLLLVYFLQETDFISVICRKPSQSQLESHILSHLPSTTFFRALSCSAGPIRNSNQVESEYRVVIRVSGMIDDAYTYASGLKSSVWVDSRSWV